MTQVRRLINSDKKSIKTLLNTSKATTLFMQNNINTANIEFSGAPYQGEYFGTFEGSTLTSVIAQYWNGNIMAHAQESDHIEILCRFFEQERNRPIKGFIGERQLMTDLRNRLSHDTNILIDSQESLFQLELENLIDPTREAHSSALLIPAKKLDEALLFTWLKAYNIETLGAVDNEKLISSVQESVTQTLKGDHRWALQINGDYVALAGFNAIIEDTVQVGPVWTPVKYRNNGFARLLVFKMLELASTRNIKTAVLFTNNEAARKAYEALGFAVIGQYTLCLLK